MSEPAPSLEVDCATNEVVRYCLDIEEALGERLVIPIFREHWHGLTIITAADMCNALELQGKPFGLGLRGW